MICLALGCYFLAIDPRARVDLPNVDLSSFSLERRTAEVLSLQKLAIGVASVIAAAVFFTGGVATWRD